MLEEQIHPYGLTGLGVLDLVEQVGLAFAQVLVHEGAVEQGQGRPVKATPDGVGQCVPQQAGGFTGVGEDGPKEPVMRFPSASSGGCRPLFPLCSRRRPAGSVS